MSSPLLTTKLHIPQVRTARVLRPHLIKRLQQGLAQKLTLISAPAGYGKTTLLCEWLAVCGQPTAWVSLDRGDNDPGRFWAYVLSALHGAFSSASITHPDIPTSPNRPPSETLLTELINELDKHPQPLILVLDDYHLIETQAIHDGLSFLLEHAPHHFHLVVATRADPPLPLARLRARSDMLEIRLADLRFTLQEAADFLNHTMGLKILPEEVARITARTEGWIAGLQIAALSMQNSDDVSGFITAFTGNHHYIFDYLLEEILGRQSLEIRRFLLYTSILDQLTAPMCDALLEGDMESSPTRSSSVILEELEHANLFILPLDHDHRWYRYHHLFSDLLRLMLERSHPGLSAELHRRACRWYEAQEMLPESLQHAISSGDMQLVTQIVSANVLVLVENNEIAPTLAKIDSLSPEEMIALPWLGIARAWALGAGQIQKSQQLLDAVEKSVANAPDTTEPQRLKGHIAAARAFVLGVQGDRSIAITHARDANELLPVDEISVRALNLTIWGDMLVADGNGPKALPILEQALALARQANKAHMIMIAAGSLANANLFAGKLHELHRVCLDALATAEDYQRRFQHPLSATAEVYSLLARVLVEWGENEKAIQFAHKGVILSEHWGRIIEEERCLSYLGRALMLSNDQEQARRVLDRADILAQKISPKYWQMIAIFTLETMLDCETPDASKIAQQMHRVKEGGARFPALLTARLKLRDNQPGEALVGLEQALSELNGQPSFDTVRIYALRALAFQAQGDEKQALSAMRQALELGEPENRIATFVRENVAMERLLRLVQTKSIAPAFVQRLLTAFEARRKHKPVAVPTTAGLLEPLSERELEILKLLAQGYSDKKIAETLVIARETVHKHLKNIYGKLGVHSRTEAIVHARELGLL
jgi:LuxR family maltose regulon positive regulatory protein